MSRQGEFNFDELEDGRSEDGHTRWLAGRQLAAQELARRINLPIGHQVEVWLFGGIRLRGKLGLRDEMLFIEEENLRHIELVVDQVVFTYREMESCVRTD